LSKLLIALEVAIELNNIDDIKTLFSEPFTSTAELKTLVAAQLARIANLQIEQAQKEVLGRKLREADEL
jgi:hypothetical protein